MGGGSLLAGMAGSLSSAEGGSLWIVYSGSVTNDMLCSLMPLFALDTYVKKGAITCSRLGTRVRFTQDDIDKALAKNRSN
jgi:hypothetical protein